jgi:hypothetical protein
MYLSSARIRMMFGREDSAAASERENRTIETVTARVTINRERMVDRTL